jgi:hypothetical protein
VTSEGDVLTRWVLRLCSVVFEKNTIVLPTL